MMYATPSTYQCVTIAQNSYWIVCLPGYLRKLPDWAQSYRTDKKQWISTIFIS